MADVASATLLLLLLPVADGVGQPGDCRQEQLSVIAAVGDRLARGDEAYARRTIAAIPADDTSCASLQLMRHGLNGWFAARALAPVAAAPEHLAPVRQLVERVADATSTGGAGAVQHVEVRRLQVEYAQTLINAAIAAAQDERPEMELLLDHARDLVQRLEQRGERARWPRPYNLAAGELWFEVDRYEEARAAYERALQGEAPPVAVVGVARALARLGRLDAACAMYKRARDAAAELHAAAKADLARCQ